ncbi:hypothetical protein BsWGS_23330 [Bradybaena similaris]
MEIMDFESDDELGVGFHNRSVTPHSSLTARRNLSDFSDMDVDPGSPSQDPAAARASASFDHINQALSSMLTLNNVNDDSDNDTSHSDEKHAQPYMSTPNQRSENLQFPFSDSKKTWQPAATVVLGAARLKNTKPGCTVPFDETKCKQTPDIISSNSIRQRFHVDDIQSDTNKNQLISYSKLEESVSPKNGYKRWSSCFAFMPSLILLTLFLIIMCYFGVLYINNDIEQCRVSRHFNKQVLTIELEANVFGQHLATKTVPDKIEEYFRRFDDNSLSEDASTVAPENVQICKPLVLSFDGWTGVGKNYVSKFISEAFQHFTIMNYVVPYNFPHKSFEDMYRRQIQEWILGNFSQCKVNIIIIDEVDKAFPTVIEGLTESIKLLTKPCSSTSPTIFLLLSNTHGNDINRIFLKFLLDSPTRKREEISLDHFNSVFTSELNDWTSSLSSTQLIDAFVPFLPLEVEHVIQCIKKDLVSKRFSTDAGTVKRVLEELSFFSLGEVYLSQTGCKRVADKVDLVMFEK